MAASCEAGFEEGQKVGHARGYKEGKQSMDAVLQQERKLRIRAEGERDEAWDRSLQLRGGGRGGRQRRLDFSDSS